MQKFKSIKILFIFLAFNVFLAKYPLWNSLGALITIYLLNFEGINDDLKNFKIISQEVKEHPDLPDLPEQA